MNQDHTPIKESDQKKIKAYIIGLLAQVFSHERDTHHSSLKAKKELDQIVSYINPKGHDPWSGLRTCFLVPCTSKYLGKLSSKSGIFKCNRKS